MKPFLPIAVLAAALAAPSAQAATYKVTSATHTSTSQKAEHGYAGTSTTRWRLATPVKLRIQGGSGLAALKVEGADAVDITTDWPNGRCAWSKPLGEEVNLMFTPGRVSFMGTRASLSDMYLGTECSTSIGGEPKVETTNSKVLPASAFRKKTVKLTFAGTTADQGITYSWSTKITLKRVRR